MCCGHAHEISQSCAHRELGSHLLDAERSPANDNQRGRQRPQGSLDVEMLPPPGELSPHLFAAPWCEICVHARGKSDWDTGVKYDSEMLCVQIDFKFISGVGVWCPEAQAKATVLTVVDVDTGYVGFLMVTRKSADKFMVRPTAAFVEATEI